MAKKGAKGGSNMSVIIGLIFVVFVLYALSTSGSDDPIGES
jgi:hypothetical protein